MRVSTRAFATHLLVASRRASEPSETMFVER